MEIQSHWRYLRRIVFGLLVSTFVQNRPKPLLAELMKASFAWDGKMSGLIDDDYARL